MGYISHVHLVNSQQTTWATNWKVIGQMQCVTFIVGQSHQANY